MFNKYKQLILSSFVFICCLTDITHAKSSRIEVFDCHVSRHALHKTTLAMHRAHQRALEACSCMCPQAYCQAQQLAQLQAQCAFNQEQTARILQATEQALQVQQEKTAAIINQLTEQLATMQQQCAALEQKYKHLEELAPKPAQELIQLPEQSLVDRTTQESGTQELPELQEQSQQAILDELSGKKHAMQEPQESTTQAPVLESKEPQPDLQLDDVDQQSAPENTISNTQQDSTQDKTNDKAQEVETIVPEEIISGKSVICEDNEDEEDAALEQRLLGLLDLLQEKQQIINRLSQEKQVLERENARLKQEIQDYQSTLKEAHDTLFVSGEQSQKNQKAHDADQDADIEKAVQQSLESLAQQKLDNYQATLRDMLTEKKTLQQNLAQAHEYIDKQKKQQRQAEQELRETRKALLKTSTESVGLNRELQEKTTQLERAMRAFTVADNNHKEIAEKHKTLKQQISQASQIQDMLSVNTPLNTNISIQKGHVSLKSSPHTNACGNYLYPDYTLTFIFGDKTVVMNTNDKTEQNKQAIEELIKIIEELEEPVIEHTQECLQKVLEECYNLQNHNLKEPIEILHKLFYRSSFCPDPAIIVLTGSSLLQLADSAAMTNTNRIYKKLLSNMSGKIIEQSIDADDQEDIQDLSDQENVQDIQQTEQQAIVEQTQPEKSEEATPKTSQGSWLNPLNWLRRK